MVPANPQSSCGLEALSWNSLTSQEKLVVASLLETSQTSDRTANLAMVAAELRDDARLRLAFPLAFTPLQNRAIALALEQRADQIEQFAEAARNPVLSRTGHYAAGFVRSLVDRLVKANPADDQRSLEWIAQMLLVERQPGSASSGLAAELVERCFRQLEAIGLANVFWPVLEQYAEQAAATAGREGAAPAADDVLYDFEVVDATAERRALAHAAFERALEALWNDDEGWGSFLKALGLGGIPGCEAATGSPVVAARAANTAFAIAVGVREHLQLTRDYPWDAVRPGLKAILDRYPALKRVPMLKAFVRHQLCELHPSAALLG